MTTGAGGIAGTVVLFHPERDVLDNIRTYLPDLAVLFAIDNTPQPDPGFVGELASLPNVVHVPLGDNLGVAKALNVAARMAAERGFSRLLTMDQDSAAFTGMVPALARCMDEAGACTAVASASMSGFEPVGSGFSPVLIAITAGSLIDLTVWREIGGFLEGLFVDQVDHEYCMRAQCCGFQVVKCHEAALLHAIGAPSVHRLAPFVSATVSNHPAVRRYYIARNHLFVQDLYRADFPKFWRGQRIDRVKETLKIVLFESNKRAKLAMAHCGRRDHRRGLLGRYPDGLHHGASELAAVRSVIAAHTGLSHGQDGAAT